MARPLRVEYPGALYHVMNRGNRRERVFRTRADYRLFLERLGRFAEDFEVEVLSYCLMPNHFHLFLRTRQANLSRFMQSLLTSFTVFVNRRDKSSGHIFQGRFKAQLVEGGGYYDTLSRYIHLNPVRVQSVKNLPMEERRRVLAEFKWSSFPALIGLAKTPEWLRMAGILKGFGATLRKQMQGYRLFVEEGLMKEICDPAAAAEARSILGSEGFVDWVRREFLLRRPAAGREQPELQMRQGGFSLAEVVAAAARVTGIPKEVLKVRRCRDRAARDLLAALVRRHCRGRLRPGEMARELELSYSGFVHASERGRAQEQTPGSWWDQAVASLQSHGDQG